MFGMPGLVTATATETASMKAVSSPPELLMPRNSMV